MLQNNISRPVLVWVLIGLMVISLIGVTGLVILMDELVEEGWTPPRLIQGSFPFPQSLAENSGDEFSGEATAWLFGASLIPVAIDLFSRAILRNVPLGEPVKGFIRRINKFQKKYLMWTHTLLSILGLGLGIWHLALSSCAANPLPELSLFLLGILVVTGLLFKWNAVPKSFRKFLFQFHANLIVSGVILTILFTGHVIMDFD